MLPGIMLASVALLFMTVSAYALNPQPEPPGVGTQVNRVNTQAATKGNDVRSNPTAKPTEAAGSDSGSDGHGKNARVNGQVGGNPSEKKNWAAGSDSGSDSHAKPADKKTWAAGSESGEGKTLKKRNLATH